jgi:hypothetical protein
MRLEWGQGPRPYEQGLDQGVLYLADGAVPWNGLIRIQEEDTADVEESQYFDGVKFYSTESLGDYKGQINAYTYPDEFAEYDGHSERDIYKRFGLSYRTQRTNGYRLHLVYNALVTPQGLGWGTIAEAPTLSTFNWDIQANPEPVTGGMPTAHMILDSDDLNFVTPIIEDILYGTDTIDPRLPTPDELVDIFEAATTLRITYHKDGSYTASGPPEVLEIFDDGTFKIKAPTAFVAKDGRFQVSSF